MEGQKDVIMCSETLFPDLFVVDEPASRVSPAQTADAAGTDGIVDDESFQDSVAHPLGVGSAAPADASAETQLYLKQVEVNMALFKQRIFAVLKLFHTSDEEREVYSTVNSLQRQVEECPAVVSFMKMCSAAERKSGRPPSAGGGGDGGILGSHSSTPVPAPVLTHHQKETLRNLQTIDSLFRFNLEEIALRWAAKQDRPFNLKTYHDVASAQIELRQQARHAQGVSEHKVQEQQKSIEDLTRRLSVHDDAHAEHMKLYLHELQLLRAQILDMQRRLKVQEDIPQLVGKVDGDGGGGALYQVQHEKHVEFVNRRLTEECALLVHTLEQRNQVIKALQVELSQVKQAAAIVRDEFRKYITEQEKLDVDFRSQYAQNESAMNQAVTAHAIEVEKGKQLTATNKRLSDELSHLQLVSDALKADLQETQVELGQTKRMQSAQLEENRYLRSSLEDANEKISSQKVHYEQLIQAARKRIEELEQSDVKAKLEEALRRIGELENEVAQQQERIRQQQELLAATEEQHKKVVRDFEKKIRAMDEAKEAADKRRIETIEAERKRFKEQADKRVQAVEQEKQEQALAFQHQLDAAEKFQEDLLHEIMLAHRQATLVDKFLAKGPFSKEQLRDLARDLLTADIAFTSDMQPEESLSTSSPQQEELEAVHTPRTLEYFKRHRLFDPAEMQQRIALANEALESVRTQAAPASPSKSSPLSTGASLTVPTLRARLAKSTVSIDFLHDVKERLHSRMPPGYAPATAGGGESSTLQQSVHLEGSIRTQLSLTPAWTSAAAADSLMLSQDSGGGGGGMRSGNHLTDSLQQQMMMEELKSQVVTLKMREGALLEELQKHQDDMFSGGGGIQTRPSSGDDSSRPHSSNRRRSFANQSFSRVRSMDASVLQRQASNMGGFGAALVTEGVGGSSPMFGTGDGIDGGAAQSFLDFPGLEHAAEYFDMFESFEQMRMQLKHLVDICTMDTQRGALDPHDLERAKELLHAKFSCFRAVESHASIILQRLRKKKDDMMRRREEELEKVLGAMQNLSLTHPTEARQLVKAARVARQQHQPQRSVTTPTDARESSLTAIVERPHSSMSASQAVRKLNVAPRDVIVSGAAALMCLRGSQRLGSAKPGNHSK